MKKFALIGTSCIGKTTLLRELEFILSQQLGKKVITVPEASRDYFQKRKVRKPFSYFNQRNIQNLARKLEEEAEKKNPDIILCDRSVLDAVAYVNAVGGEVEARRLWQKEKNWLTTYVHFFLLDPEGIPYQTDAIRRERSETREAFHQSFVAILGKVNLPFTLVSGRKDQRLETMIKIITSSMQ